MQAATETLKKPMPENTSQTCEVCGNDYDRCFQVRINGEMHTFDSFECAIHALAPRCTHCGCAIIGHGVEADGLFYCCEHCARLNNASDLEHGEPQHAAERSPA